MKTINKLLSFFNLVLLKKSETKNIKYCLIDWHSQYETIKNESSIVLDSHDKECLQSLIKYLERV
jgi:hypothetical protein